MDEASAAKLEELRLGAVSQGKEWLSRALYEMRKEELRVLATAGGVETRSGKAWLPVAELRNSLMKVLEPSTEVGFGVEIRLQELRSSAVTRGREWLQDALANISVMEIRKMAHARNVGRGPDNKWLAVGELRARLLDVLAPRMQVRWGRIGL